MGINNSLPVVEGAFFWANANAERTYKCGPLEMTTLVVRVGKLLQYLDPKDESWRRIGVWSRRVRERVVESAMAGFPLPTMYAIANPLSGGLEFVRGSDSAAFIAALREFVGDEMRLIGPMVLFPDIQGKSWDDLHPALRTRLLDTPITVHVASATNSRDMLEDFRARVTNEEAYT